MIVVASRLGHIDCVKLLILSGAEVETPTNKGATPLYGAAQNSHKIIPSVRT